MRLLFAAPALMLAAFSQSITAKVIHAIVHAFANC
jgi:hypothetical protein